MFFAAFRTIAADSDVVEMAGGDCGGFVCNDMAEKLCFQLNVDESGGAAQLQYDPASCERGKSASPMRERVGAIAREPQHPRGVTASLQCWQSGRCRAAAGKSAWEDECLSRFC